MRVRLLAAFLMILAAPLPAASGSGGNSASAPMLGTAWYPEQWPESRWEADLTLMERAGIRIVRIAEFAWSTIEPSEGDFRLDWLDRAIRAAERHRIQVVLGTPTAGPPAWLTSRYPDLLRTLPDGKRAQHGGRHQASYTDPRFAALARAVVGKMADRFGHDPNVIGWQIDNEIGTGDWDEATHKAFQAWLRTQYRTLDTLNARWTTSYWSQTYQDWSQIPIPGAADGNPGLMLAWRRFVSERQRAFLANQLGVLKERVAPGQRITTNYWIDARAKAPGQLSADLDDLDLYETSRDLDFASWDEYFGAGHIDPVRFGITHDLLRGLLGRNFWVMETQPGRVNWSDRNISLDPGETRAAAWHAVGHGADAVAYWQWRSALGGQEQYHGTIVGVDGTPLPIYDEIARIGAEFARAAPFLTGTTVAAQAAVLNDYPSRWAIGWQRIVPEFSSGDAIAGFYAPLHARMRSVDVVAPTAPLSHYRLVVAPALNVLTPEAAANLASFVKGGGHLVLGARSGFKDEENAMWPQRQPGPLASLLGAHVVQWYALERSLPVEGPWGSGEATTWAEQLEVTAPDARVVLHYGPGNGWLEGRPAAVSRSVGHGSITYVGATLDPALTAAIIDRLAQSAGLAKAWPMLPEGIDMAVREKEGTRVTILTNYGSGERRIALPTAMRDVLAGGPATAVTLPHYGVAVLADGVTVRHLPGRPALPAPRS